MKTIEQYISEHILKRHLKKQKHYEYVDLGLSVKWAPCNLGANTPQEYGDYFASGETTPKEKYTYDTYNFRNDVKKITLENDVAHINMGGSWRLPTIKEINELFTKTDVFQVALKGVLGRKFVSKTDDTKWIFIPYAGYYHIQKVDAKSEFTILSSDVRDINMSRVGYANYYNALRAGVGDRELGFSVRPVCK